MAKATWWRQQAAITLAEWKPESARGVSAPVASASDAPRPVLAEPLR
jgi:hypothetical protein